MKYKMLAMDVDGTLTDGRIYIGAHGEVMKAFDVRDGYGIVEFIREGGIVALITGRRSSIVEERCRELGIVELHQGVANKLECLKQLTKKFCLDNDEIIYIGDDMNDLECLNYVGLSACPADAVRPIRDAARYICSHEGGHGAARELIDLILSERET